MKLSVSRWGESVFVLAWVASNPKRRQAARTPKSGGIAQKWLCFELSGREFVSLVKLAAAQFRYPESPADRTRWILLQRGEKARVEAQRPYAFLLEQERGPN